MRFLDDMRQEGRGLEGCRLPASLGHALRFLESRLDAPVRLEALAAAAGVRPRTLEAQFRRQLGTSPLGWVRRTRLARARQQLLTGRGRGSVTGGARASC